MSQDDIFEREMAKLASKGVQKSKVEDDLLAEELGKIGSSYDGLGGKAIELTSRFLPDDTGQCMADVRASAKEVFKEAYNILKREGTISDKPQSDPKLPTVCGIVGTGYLNMNPAVIKIFVAPISEDVTRVLVTGSAKEGLIKQYGGKKAAERIMSLITQSFSSVPVQPTSISEAPIAIQTHPPAPRAETAQFSIFLSYRRADSADVTGRIYDYLVQDFGQEGVFKDVDSIPLGVDFRKFLSDSVSRCNMFLAIIGKRWVVTENGQRRLDDPGDFVRIEVESALQRNIPVIPVLVSGATMPSESELPKSIKPIVFRNAIQIRPDPDFRNDINRLIRGLKENF